MKVEAMKTAMHLRGIGYALAASCMFGLGAVLAQLVGKEIDATIVAFLCLAIGGLLVAACLPLSGKSLFRVLPTLKRRDWHELLLLACPGTALPLLLIVAGFARTSALVGGFLLQINGVAALVFALLLLSERVRLKQYLGILLLLIGSTLVIFKSTQGGWSGGLSGDLLILGGAVCLGFSFVPAKRLSQRIDTLALTALRLLLGACSLLPVVIFQLITNAYGHSLLWQPSLMTLLWVFPCYIVSNFFLGYLSQQEGFRFIKAWEMASIMQTVPIFSTLFAVLVLHDSLTLLQAAGGVLAIIGGIVVSLNNEARTPPIPTPLAPTDIP
jgi:drug/metabolite transporter (DMT)-like permease